MATPPPTSEPPVSMPSVTGGDKPNARRPSSLGLVEAAILAAGSSMARMIPPAPPAPSAAARRLDGRRVAIELAGRVELVGKAKALEGDLVELTVESEAHEGRPIADPALVQIVPVAGPCFYRARVLPPREQADGERVTPRQIFEALGELAELWNERLRVGLLVLVKGKVDGDEEAWAAGYDELNTRLARVVELYDGYQDQRGSAPGRRPRGEELDDAIGDVVGAWSSACRVLPDLADRLELTQLREAMARLDSAWLPF